MILTLASLAFFLSGFAALVYQIAWQRLLVLPIGADVYSTTVVVTMFMAGLGIGSLVGGHAADRLSWRRNLQLFVAAELAVGLFGLVSRALLYDWQYLRLSAAGLSPVWTLAVSALTLAWPTFWMGVSLPFLGKAVSRQLEGAARRVGTLYGLNTLGAATGALVSTWFLLPRLGLDGTLRTAAALNAGAAVAVAFIAWRGRESSPSAQQETAALVRTGESDPTAGWTFTTWAALYCVAGFLALSLEIVWFRLLGVMLKSSAFTFGTLLTIYLAGLGIGSALASPLLPRITRPGLWFLGLQAFIGLYALASIGIVVEGLEGAKVLAPLAAYFGSYEPIDAARAARGFWDATDAQTRAQLVRTYVVLPLFLIGPPTLAMGASFPLMQKLALVDLSSVGRRIGTLLVANIGGSLLGSMVTGWATLNLLGSANALKALALVSTALLVTMVAVALTRQRLQLRLAAMAVCASGGVVLTAASPDNAALWARLHGTSPAFIVHHEDATGVSLIKREPSGFGDRGVVFVNGIGQSWIPYGNIHTVLGALPAFIHRDPRTAALIGLGSGDTLYALAGRQELTGVTSIEIIRPQLTTLRAWHEHSGYPAIGTLLNDPRIDHVFGDGRIHVMKSTDGFDLIEADALRPGSAYSGNLYSVGYFELLRDRLAPGGLATTWAPTPRIRDTFASVFPHVLAIGDIVLGSRDPIEFDPVAIRQRLRTPAVQAHFARAGVDIEALLAPYLDRAPTVIDSAVIDRHDLNEDLFPRDEFAVARAR